MMWIMKKQDVKKLSDLSRIGMSEAEQEEFVTKISSVLQSVAQVRHLPETVDASSDTELGRVYNRWRRDEVKPIAESEREAIIEAFPESKNEALKVKKIIGEE